MMEYLEYAENLVVDAASIGMPERHLKVADGDCWPCHKVRTDRISWRRWRQPLKECRKKFKDMNMKA